MYDLTDLIFENYTEGKLSEDKMILLLEADKNNDKEELAKKKKAVAKKIAATLLVVAGISAVIVLCKKSGDTDGEEKLLNLREKFNSSLKEAKSDLSNAKTVSEVNAVEAKVNNVEKNANNAKRYKVKGGGKVSLPAWKHEYVSSYRKSGVGLDNGVDLLDNERDKEAVRRYYGQGTDNKQKISKKYVKQIGRQFDREAKEINDEVNAYNKKLVEKNREWRASKQHGRKLHFVKNSVDDIISDSYKYLYMIESVVERYDRDIITYESTMDIIDTICVFEAHNDTDVFNQELDSFTIINNSDMTDEDKERDKKLKDDFKHCNSKKKKYELYHKCYLSGRNRPLTKLEYSYAKNYVDQKIKSIKENRLKLGATMGITAVDTAGAIYNMKKGMYHPKSMRAGLDYSCIAADNLFNIRYGKKVKQDKRDIEEAKKRLNK